MGVTVVVPCRNEAMFIERCVMSLVNNGYDLSQLEVLVVDGISTDGTVQIVEQLMSKYPSVKLLNNPKKQTPFAMNIGIASAKFDKILIAGAHADYPKGYIAQMDKLTDKPEIDVAGGVLKTEPGNNTTKARAIAYVLGNQFGVGNSMFRVGVSQLTKVDTVPFGMYKRKVFEKAGVYNERLIRNQDIELSRRVAAAGFNIWLDPTFSCTYFSRTTFSKLAQNNYKNGYWNILAVKITRNFKSLSIRHFVPMIFLLSLIFLSVGSVVFGPWCVILLASDIFVYLLALVALGRPSSDGNNPLLVIIAFFVLHLSYGLGSVMGIFSKK